MSTVREKGMHGVDRDTYGLKGTKTWHRNPGPAPGLWPMHVGLALAMWRPRDHIRFDHKTGTVTMDYRR